MNFSRVLEDSLQHARLLLENDCQLVSAAEVPHTYNDKYHLANFLTTCALNSLHVSLAVIGLTKQKLEKLKELSGSVKKNISVRFNAEHRCMFDRKSVRQIESDSKSV